MVRRLLRSLLFVSLVATSVQATTILFPTAGAIAATNTAGIFDVRGLANISVFDTEVPGIVGNAILSGTNPYPSSHLHLFSTDLSQEVAFDFDFAGASALSTTLVVPVSGAAVGVVTDPALTSMLGTLLATFVRTGATGNTQSYLLSTVVRNQGISGDSPAPEPLTSVLVGSGLVAAAIVLRRRSGQ